jgi:uncharacterized membrane protein (UPF0136 family)
MIEPTRIYYFIFGALTIVGGVMGFVKAKSKASLIAGGVSGVLLLLAGWLIATKLYVGLGLGMVVSLALAGRFVPGFLESKKMMPAGMMAILSVIAIILTGAALALH